MSIACKFRSEVCSRATDKREDDEVVISVDLSPDQIGSQEPKKHKNSVKDTKEDRPDKKVDSGLSECHGYERQLLR